MPTKLELIEKYKLETYGHELVLDIHEVEPGPFTGPMTLEAIKKFAADLCAEIGMITGPCHAWGTDEDKNEWFNPKTNGISCVQFLHSSSITIHAIDPLGKVFINIFSCEAFDIEKAKAFSLAHFGGVLVSSHSIVRN